MRDGVAQFGPGTLRVALLVGNKKSWLCDPLAAIMPWSEHMCDTRVQLTHVIALTKPVNPL